MTARVGTDKVGNDLLLQTFLFVYLFKDLFKLVEQLKRRFAHEAQNGRTGVFRSHFQASAHMVDNEFARIFCCRLVAVLVLAPVQKKVITHTASYKAFLYVGQSINGTIDLKQF